ncbi:AsmA family protein [Tanticharoenia sakaeratensis]|uniref:AsmA domain-containing protein n=1 Tax=Tanticharoenia sakaeratensis NBRC 103193 TaxID=1231623 RepID=A0A0D6MP02_9PROT|nr:AsmA family protein [Tanticharoenia sakaeratensis]GAN55412.1 hypothetical protein Tasa_048_037 [Tanticharoenia sakaeratensis NBRC 103193]GBQ22136.1 lipopolysaccharide biogenesis periplasmic protein AsmA [Tanticharoenia sakaeratensis NBRC 103193]
MTEQTGADAAPKTRTKRRHPVLKTFGSLLGVVVVLLILLIIFWDWDWFVPTIDRRASAAAHRPVSIAHLHVHLGWTTTVSVDDLRVAQPDTFKSEKEDFASARSVTVSVKPWDYITGHGITLPLIALDTPRGDIVSLLNGRNNYTFSEGTSTSSSSSSQTALPKIGELRITNGDIRIAMAKLHSDFRLKIHTTPPENGNLGTIVADANGRYARAPITGHFVGGTLLTLANPKNPYPIDLRVANGPTYVTLHGTVDDPVHFAGARLALHFAGPDMALLYPLTGIPIPQTPHYSVTGNLDYSKSMIRFNRFEGRLGNSDIGGDINVDPHQHVPYVDAKLHSHLVDLADLAGFVGGKPGHAPATPVKADSNVLPDQRISVPKLNSVNAHIVYHGDHIENKRLPLDNIDTDVTVQHGAIDVHKLNFAVGSGTLASDATLKPAANDNFATRFRLDVSRVQVARLMQGAGAVHGQGTIGGHITLASTGHSVADLVANGDGGVTLVLDQGGNLSAILPDLLGLQVGNAILSALGIPDRTPLQCFIADMPLRNGILSTHSLLIQTGDTRTTGSGTVDFRKNTLDYAITTRAIHFTVASFPGAVHISGPIRSPTILPGAELIGRLAATAGLAALFPPAAILPTIQLGVGKGSVCEQAVQQANANPAAGIAPGATTGAHPSAAARAGAAQAATSHAAPHRATHAATHHAAHTAAAPRETASAAQVRAAWAKKQHTN